MHLHAGNPPGPGTSTVLRTLPSDQLDDFGDTALPVPGTSATPSSMAHISKTLQIPGPPTLSALLDGATYFNCLTLLRSRPHTGLAITHYARAGSWSWSKGGPLTPPCFPNPRPRPRASMAALSIWWCRSWRPFGFFGFARNNWPLVVLCACTRSSTACSAVPWAMLAKFILLAAGSHRQGSPGGVKRNKTRQAKTRQRKKPNPSMPSGERYCLLPVQSLKVGFCESHGCLSSSPHLLYR